MSKKPKVSVIMSVYDENKKILKESIHSILNQTFQDLEFIVIYDNPENEGLWCFLKYISSMDDRILLIKNKKNMGLARSLNIALSLAKGKYIARMDADDISIPDRLKIQYEYMEKHTEIALIGSWAYSIDISGNKRGIIKLPTRYSTIKRILKYKNPMLHPSWFGRKEIFQDLKGYKEFLKVSQDYDFLVRAIFKGFIIKNIPEILLNYRFRPDKSGYRHPFYKVMTEILIQKNYLYLNKYNKDILTHDLYIKYIQENLGKRKKIEKTRKYILDFLYGNSFSLLKALFIYPSLTLNFLYKASVGKVLEVYDYIGEDS